MQIYYFSADKHEMIYVQDRQCAYTVTWRRVRVTTVAVEEQQVLHILSVFL